MPAPLRRGLTGLDDFAVSCEPALAMVVSETGEIESPNVAPARMAPISTAGGAARAPPAG